MPTHSNETDIPSSSLRRYSKDAPSVGRAPNRVAHAKRSRNLGAAIGLSRKESLILEYLIANPGRYVGDRQMSMLMFGIFDGDRGPDSVQKTICGIRSKWLSEFGVDPIHCDPERGYMVVSRQSAVREAR